MDIATEQLIFLIATTKILDVATIATEQWILSMVIIWWFTKSNEHALMLEKMLVRWDFPGFLLEMLFLSYWDIPYKGNLLI